MNVTSIGSYGTTAYEPMTYPTVEQQTATTSSTTESTAPTTDWQKDILLTAINDLENTLQLDDSHPLDREGNTPIETLDEALIEASMLNSPTYQEEAAGAQANLSGEDVLYLFSGE
ncbi:MAG: hypothetical protein ACLFQX_10025 [Candidatus Kapaibacterium sp.]